MPVAILHLNGPLNARCYVDLMGKAKQIYGTGTRHIILDMSDISWVDSSSMFILYSIAAVLRGEEPLDPENGWGAMQLMANDLETGTRQEQFKLFNPKPQVREALEQTGFAGFLEIHTDLDTATSSFQAGRRH